MNSAISGFLSEPHLPETSRPTYPFVDDDDSAVIELIEGPVHVSSFLTRDCHVLDHPLQYGAHILHSE